MMPSQSKYALPEAVDALRAVRKAERTGETVTVSAADPLNLVGIVLPGARVPALAANSITYVDGIVEPSSLAGEVSAPAAGGEIRRGKGF